MATLEEVKRLAFYTVALDLAGRVEIQQSQHRMVLDRDGVPDRELELLPIELLHVANPTPQDSIADTLEAVLGEVNGALAARVVELEAQLAAARDRADRLQILVDTFAPEPGDAPEQPAP